MLAQRSIKDVNAKARYSDMHVVKLNFSARPVNIERRNKNYQSKLSLSNVLCFFPTPPKFKWISFRPFFIWPADVPATFRFYDQINGFHLNKNTIETWVLFSSFAFVLAMTLNYFPDMEMYSAPNW